MTDHTHFVMRRIYHIIRMTGIEPKVLDVPPDIYEALVEELGPRCRWSDDPPDQGWLRICGVKIVKGLHPPSP